MDPGSYSHVVEQLACVVLSWGRGLVVTGSFSDTAEEESMRSSRRQRRGRDADGLSWSFEGFRDMLGWWGWGWGDTHTHTHTYHNYLKATHSHRPRVNLHRHMHIFYRSSHVPTQS